jgi:hypothetical protein
MGKSPLLSKTLWLNVIAVIAMVVQGQTGFVIDLDAQMAILGVVNILLRLVTKEPVVWKSQGGYVRVNALPVALVATLLALMLTPLIFSGCALKKESHATVSARALLSTQATVVSLASAADDLCTAGTLTQVRCDLASDLYDKAAAAYDTAADLLVVAIVSGEEGSGSPAWANFRAAADRFATFAADFRAVASAFGLTPEPIQ